VKLLNRELLITLNNQESRLNGEVGHAWSKNVILNTAKGASSVWTDFQTHVWLRDCWNKLKNTNITSLHPKRRGNVENKTSFAQSRSNLSAIHQTSQVSLKTTDLTLKDQKWQHWFVTR